MLFNFQPPTVKHGEVMTERQIREYLYKLVDNLTLVLNNIDSENMAQGATGSTEALSKEIAALRIRINKLSGEIADTDVSEFQSALNSLTARMNEAEAALAEKQEQLVSGTNIKTVNGTSILGSGNIVTPTYDDTALAGRVSSLETASSSLSSQLSSLQTAVSALEAALSGKADASSVTALSERMSTAETDIGSLKTNKQDKLVSGTNVKTINGTSILGSGNISISGEGSSYDDTDLRNRISAAESDIDSLQSDKQDKLVSGTNIKTVNGTSILGNGDITTPTYDDTALASRVSTAETNITTLQKSATRADSLDTETHLSSTISATATAATEYVLTFDKAYTNMPVVSALIYNSSPTRYFGLLSLILTGYVKDSSGNYTGVNFKICNNHTSALNVRIRSTVIGFK